ncbi:MAG: hypothetical protein GY737_28230 [Desulfobacteraceae bacterium]|nr:hypothetical protein [Desulfobacteraceae bacterium]
MKKTLIGSSRVDEFVKEGEKTLYMDKTMILTPGAKDILRNRGVVIEYGPRPVADTGETAPVSSTKEVEESQESREIPAESMDCLVTTIVGLLRNDFGVNDPEALREISLKVLNKINNQ